MLITFTVQKKKSHTSQELIFEINMHIRNKYFCQHDIVKTVSLIKFSIYKITTHSLNYKWNY